MTPLYRVLYCSRNVIPGSPDAVAADIRAILAASRRNNARAGVTGGLLFSEGCFAQVLEGPMEAVEATFERIQCDPRHAEVTVLRVGPIPARDFPGWSMGFAGPATAAGRYDGMTPADALSGQSPGGADVLAMLKALVVREAEWLAPVGEAVLF